MRNKAQIATKTDSEVAACEAKIAKICRKMKDLAYELDKATDNLRAARLLEIGGQDGTNVRVAGDASRRREIARPI